MIKRQNERSPLRDAPLRNPGQSLDRAIGELLDDKVLFPLLLAVLLVVFAVQEWIRAYTAAPPQPWLFTTIAVAYGAYFATRLRSTLKELRALKLGRDGERAVGQYLEHLRSGGAQVVHDIPGPDFNIDHVIVARQGIFTVETKTWSKPATGEPRISFSGGALRAARQSPDRDPTKQALAQAHWLADMLGQSTGRAVKVRSVVVFPGWFVEPAATREAARSGVWLLNPKALPGFLQHEAAFMSPEDVKLIAFHLARYVRSATAA